MSEDAAALHRRRTALVARAAAERADLHDRARNLGVLLNRGDEALATIRRVATPPVILAAGVGLALALGRQRSRRLLGLGLAALGTLMKTGALRGLVGTLLERQDVSRSR